MACQPLYLNLHTHTHTHTHTDECIRAFQHHVGAFPLVSCLPLDAYGWLTRTGDEY